MIALWLGFRVSVRVGISFGIIVVEGEHRYLNTHISFYFIPLVSPVNLLFLAVSSLWVSNVHTLVSALSELQSYNFSRHV